MQSVFGGADRGLGLPVTVAAMPDVIGQRLGTVLMERDGVPQDDIKAPARALTQRTGLRGSPIGSYKAASQFTQRDSSIC